MTTSSLRELNHEIETLIDRGQNNEAIFHCMNILRSYPKCIDTYRNLGKALLESKRYSEASDIFSKILTVYPDDFVSHVGLSIIQEDQRELDSSIWHMEQAFDSQPSNLALQEELRRLLGRRDGVPPSKVRLSRGALVRMYARGELYQQAISEIQASLKEDENRLDLQSLLAKMYHLSGANAEAAEVASRILQQYPFCFEANKILFDMLPFTGGNGNDNYKQHLTELDPYFGFISEKGISPNDIPSEKVTVEKLDYSPSSSEDGSIPDWAKLIGIDWKNGDQKSGNISDSRSLEDILSENSEVTSTSVPVNPFLDAEISNSGTSDAVSKGKSYEEPLPEWIAKAGWTRAEEFDQPQSLEENPTNDNEIVENAAPADEIPDWLKSLNLEDSTGVQIPEDLSLQNNIEEKTLTPETSVFPDQISSSDELKESLSNWSNQIEDDSKIPLAEIPQTDDWTNQLINELPGEHSAEPGELPDWLKNFEQDNETLNPNIDNISEWVPSMVQGDNNDVSSSMIADENKEFESKAFVESSGDSLVSPEFAENTELQKELTDEESLQELESITPPQLPEVPQGERKALEEVSAPAPVGRTGKLPGWIRNILSIAAPVAPVALSEIPEHKESIPEEFTEPLVSDLPEEQEHEGAISSEMKDELLSWLREVNPENEDLLNSEVQPESGHEKVTEQVANPDISLESLISDKTEPDIAAESLPGIEIEQRAGENELSAFDDRLSGLFEKPMKKVEENEFNARFSDLLSVPENATELVSDTVELPEIGIEEKDFSDYNDRLSDLLEIPKDETVSTPEIEGFVEENLITSEPTETISESLGDELSEEAIFEGSIPEENIDYLAEESQEQISPLEEIEPPQANEMEILSEPIVDEALDVEMPEPAMDVGVNLMDLVRNDDYLNLDKEINQSLSTGIPIESIIDSIKGASEEKQDKFEFWQLIGDLYSKSSKFDEAIEHYLKAEKILLK